MSRQVKAFAYEGLPAVPALSVWRSRALARAIAEASSLRSLNVRGLGRLHLQVERVEVNPWPGDSAAQSFSESRLQLVRADGSFASITVEPFFALGLVRLALGAPPPPVLRALSPSERGVLGAIVASVVVSAGMGIRVSLQRPGPIEADYVSISMLARTLALSGVVWAEIPVSWLPSAATRLPLEAGALLETALAIEAGVTSLPAGAFANADHGDVVVFEGVSPLRDESPWPCELRIGTSRTRGLLLPDGKLRLEGAFVLGPRAPVSDMSEDEAQSGRSGERPEGSEAAAVLAAAPIEVVAEIGRLSMRGDEVLGLTAGAVIPLGQRRRDLVTLRVGGRVWARGELVHIEDELGVRITEILRPR